MSKKITNLEKDERDMIKTSAKRNVIINSERYSFAKMTEYIIEYGDDIVALSILYSFISNKSKINQSWIGEQIGANRATVSRRLTALSKLGIVKKIDGVWTVMETIR